MLKAARSHHFHIPFRNLPSRPTPRRAWSTVRRPSYSPFTHRRSPLHITWSQCISDRRDS